MLLFLLGCSVGLMTACWSDVPAAGTEEGPACTVLIGDSGMEGLLLDSDVAFSGWGRVAVVSAEEGSVLRFTCGECLLGTAGFFSIALDSD